LPRKSNPAINHILSEYGRLLSQVDRWFASVQRKHPKEVVCGKGCYDCCLGLFDISLLDAYYLRQGFNQLPKSIQQKIINCAEKILQQIRKIQPNLDPPYFLSEFADEDIDVLCAKFPEIRCPLLDEQNQCLVYNYRPMTCRLNGLPLIDINEGGYFDQPDRRSQTMLKLRQINFNVVG